MTMKITVVMGFFLPVPPAAGGATEKSWHGLAVHLAAGGHDVTVISRRWPDWPDDETVGGVRHLRVRGFAHTRRLWLNLLLDFLWCLRVTFAIPRSDLTVVNAVALPCWLGLIHPSAGRVVVMPGRMPKGQFYAYNHIARILAVSTPVLDAILKERGRWKPLASVCGYPINATAFSGPRPPSPIVTLGFIGRIHPEKGLDLLADACGQLATMNLPPWRLLLCGPCDIARGGAGETYRDQIAGRLRHALPADRFTLVAPEFDEAALARRYKEIDVFCYPSLAAKGETFGVAVVEAMASGAVPVVSDLDCFRDFLRPGVNGERFDHTDARASEHLARVLADMIADANKRTLLSSQARADAQIYDYPVYTDRLVNDFKRLVSPLDHGTTDR